jgi:hypothetical protein
MQGESDVQLAASAHSLTDHESEFFRMQFGTPNCAQLQCTKLVLRSTIVAIYQVREHRSQASASSPFCGQSSQSWTKLL